MRGSSTAVVGLVLSLLLVAVSVGLPFSAGPARAPGPPASTLLAGQMNSFAPDSKPATAGGSGVLSLVPGPTGTGTTCVSANASDPYPTATSGYLNFNGDLFNLPAGAVGQTQLCYNQTGPTLSDRTLFTRLPGAARYGVLGYPEAILGENIYGGPVGVQNPLLPLPHAQIRNLTASAVWVSLNYSVVAPGNSPYDFAWDDWFSVLPANTTSTGNVGDRIELMIWYSNDIGMYLPQTPIVVPTIVGGHSAPGTWFGDHYCQGSDEITFDYLYSPSGSTPGYGLPAAQISLNFTYLLDNVSATLKAGACWASPGTDIGSLFLDNTPLGAEFYPTSSNTADVNWTVSSLCYTFVQGPPTPGAVSCHPNATSEGTPLSAALHANPTSGPAPLQVRFNATATGGKAPYSYAWDFGDGISSSNATTLSHMYSRAGTYAARLSVIDADGKTTADNVTIVVTNSPPAGRIALTSPITWAIGAASAVGLAAVTIYLLRRWARRRARREERVT
ncbi:MAG: PKD domain-containing protein [Thermoplasmata archaeon]|nr:PKD domain-containing protein [Thermoplasmata archaeon]